jgi:hypothetical protein
MNFTVWKGEIEIYPEESCLEPDREEIIHLWQSASDKGDNVIFTIGKGYELASEEFEGRTIYSIKKGK